MSTFLLTFDANTTITGLNPPTLEILIGGVVVSSVEMEAGATSYDVFVEYTGTAPSSLSVRFAGASGSGGDSINFTSVDINGTALNLGTDLTATMLAQTQASAISAAASLYGHTTPTLDTPTTTGTGNGDDLRGDDVTADIIDGLAAQIQFTVSAMTIKLMAAMAQTACSDKQARIPSLAVQVMISLWATKTTTFCLAKAIMTRSSAARVMI